MLKIKSNLTFVAVLAAITGLVFLVGCGESQEKQQMSAFIQEFGSAVQEYAKAEDGQKAELEAKLSSLNELRLLNPINLCTFACVRLKTTNPIFFCSTFLNRLTRRKSHGCQTDTIIF